MVGSLARAAARSLRAVGADGAATALAHRLAGGRYQIVTYHRVNDEHHPYFPAVSATRFAAEMELLASRFRVLPLDELLDRAQAGALPPGAIAITFDDGYRDNYRNAFPVLRRLGLPATIFLATGAVDRQVPLWHDRVFDALRDTRLSAFEWNGERIALAGGDRRSGVARVLAGFKRLRPRERDAAIEALVGRLEVEDSAARDDHMLDWDEVRRMADDGIRFGAHTVTHTIMTRLDIEAAAVEAVESKRRIETELSRPVDLFAYPNGGAGDFNEPIKKRLREAGFRCAVSTLWGANDAASDPFELRRVSLIDDDPRLAGLRLAVERNRRR